MTIQVDVQLLGECTCLHLLRGFAPEVLVMSIIHKLLGYKDGDLYCSFI